MKKLLSMILAICMMTALLPAIPATVSAVENPITYIYNFRSSQITGGVGTGIPTIDSYSKTTSGGKWMYYGMSSDLKELYDAKTTRFDAQTYGIRVQPSTLGMYAQLKLSVPETATYIPTLTFYNNGSTSIDVEVFLAPASAGDHFAEQYKLGKYTHRSVEIGKEGTASFDAVTTTEAEYVLSFRIGTHAGNIVPAQFELKETDAPKIEYTYDFAWSQETNAVREVPDVTDYVAKSGTNGRWKYYGMSDGFKYVHENTYRGELRRTFEVTQPNGHMTILFNGSGQYAQLMIEVPKTNTYFVPEFTYRMNSGSNAIKVYIAPKTAKNPRAKEYLKGVFNPHEKYNTGDTVALSGFKSDATETEYILTFENASTGTGNNLNPISLVLSETEEEEIQPVNEEYFYNFVYATAAIGAPTLDTYEKTLVNWKYCDMESTLKASYEAGSNVARTLAKCLNILPFDSSGQWLSLTLDNISAGTYNIEYTFTTEARGGIGDIYLAPATVSESERTAEKYKIGTIDYYEASGNYTTEHKVNLFKTTLNASGDYVITFKHSGTKSLGASGYHMNPSKLRLSETEPDAPAGADAGATASFTVQAEKGGSVLVNGEYEEIDNIEIGKSITVTATPNEGYAFAYWRNAAGMWLSSNATETFKINTNSGIIAVFDKIPTENDVEVSVYFYNENGSLITNKTVTKGSIFDNIKIDDPSLTGLVFDKWSIDDSFEINETTRAVALYEASDETYDIKVGTTVVASDKPYGGSVTVTSSDNNFSYWMLGEDIISYDKAFSFCSWGDVTLTEVCEGAKRAEPTVALDAIGDDFFLAYSTPVGYTKIEAGILFSKEGTPNIANFYSKASEKTGSGQFTAKSSGDGETVACGYLIFKNPAGDTRVMYTDCFVNP